MKSLQDIKYDWVTSKFYKEKNMSKWAENFVKLYGNDLDFELLHKQLKELIYQDTLIGINNFNKYGAFDMLWSTVPNALLYELSRAYEKI